ncbi:MAG: isoprenylcysteine carboxylmethyltransferase family protein [candidate division KSB1 bacterium]|nr:isoprenylcysteine carboxylmethyltransferase family protein [candidate division KSB1 bacterium]
MHVETSDTHELVTRGIYKTVRHPAYLGLSCLFIGIPLSWEAGAELPEPFWRLFHPLFIEFESKNRL